MKRYVLTADIFEKLEKGKIGAGGEIQLADALTDLNKNDLCMSMIFRIPVRMYRDKTGFVTITKEDFIRLDY